MAKEPFKGRSGLEEKEGIEWTIRRGLFDVLKRHRHQMTNEECAAEIGIGTMTVKRLVGTEERKGSTRIYLKIAEWLTSSKHWRMLSYEDYSAIEVYKSKHSEEADINDFLSKVVAKREAIFVYGIARINYGISRNDLKKLGTDYVESADYLLEAGHLKYEVNGNYIWSDKANSLSRHFMNQFWAICHSRVEHHKFGKKIGGFFGKVVAMNKEQALKIQTLTSDYISSVNRLLESEVYGDESVEKAYFLHLSMDSLVPDAEID